jgi:hypothetical protein
LLQNLPAAFVLNGAIIFIKNSLFITSIGKVLLGAQIAVNLAQIWEQR